MFRNENHSESLQNPPLPHSDLYIATYVWIDATGENLRSKCRTLSKRKTYDGIAAPDWSFDGSSTGQATPESSEVVLHPVVIYDDPFLKGDNVLVLCETSHMETNNRKKLYDIYKKVEHKGPELGIEQEYVILDLDGRPLNWPKNSDPKPQGPYYCGTGADRAFGREIVEAHYFACLHARIKIMGANAEVLPSQWEFQIGRGDALQVCDDLWMARYILHRVAEKFNAVVTFNPVPVKGNWNKSGGHFNFSTVDTLKSHGFEKLKEYVYRMKHSHLQAIKVSDPHCGQDNKERLNGKHETSALNKFTYGIGDRTASVRISKVVAEKGSGHLEDRRPASNVDPYAYAAMLLETCVLPDVNNNPAIV